MSKSQQLSEGQAKAKAYLQKHRIEEIVQDMVNTISHLQMPDPIIFMIKFLGRLHCTPEELQKNGISISSQDDIKPVLYIPFPQLNQNNAFKQYLTKDVFFYCKNNYTIFKHNFRSILQLAQENTGHKVGLFALDQDCYNAFEPIFKPVMESINKNIPDQEFKYKHHYQPSKQQQKTFEKFEPYIEDLHIKMRRNIDKIQFNAALSETERMKLNQKIQTVLKNQNIIKFAHYINLDDLTSEDHKKFTNISEKLMKKDALNSQQLTKKKGLRFPDWPKNRSIALNQDKTALVWINKEDHIQLKYIANKNCNIEHVLAKIFKFNDLLDQQMELAFSEKLGYINVKPQNTGLGMNVQFKIKLDLQDNQTFKQNVQKFKKLSNPWFAINQVKEGHNKEGRWIIQQTKSASLNQNDLLNQIEIILKLLFEGIVSLSNEQTEEKDFDYDTPIEHYDFYEENQQQICEILNQKYNRTYFGNYKITDVQRSLQNDMIFQNEHIIKQQYLIARRNILEKTTSQLRDGLLKETIIQNQYKGQYLVATQEEFKQKVQTFQSELNQKNDVIGTFYFVNEDSNLHIICNQEDHYTIYYKLSHFSISQSMDTIIQVIENLENTLLEKGYHFAEHNKFGYLTKRVKYSGTGLSLYFQLKQINEQHLDKKEYELVSLNPESVGTYCQFLNQEMEAIKRKIVYQLYSSSTSTQMKDYVGIYSEEIRDLSEYSHLNTSNANGYSLLDCWKNHQLWAPHHKFFEQYHSIYESYLTKYVDIIMKSNSSNCVNRELEIIQQRKMNIQEDIDIEVTMKFCRNFSSYLFCHLMSVHDKETLRDNISRYIKKYEDPIIIGQEYQIKDLRLNLLQQHHIEMEFTCKIQDLLINLKQVYQILGRLQGKIGSFHLSIEMGYLGPHLQDCIFNGIQTKMTLSIPSNKKDQFESLATSYQYKVEYNQDDVAILNSDHPCVLPTELNFLDDLISLKKQVD